MVPDGVDGLCELVGPAAFAAAAGAARRGGTACITGLLEGDWDVGPAEAERLGLTLRRFASGVIHRDSRRSAPGFTEASSTASSR